MATEILDEAASGPWRSEYLALHDPLTALPNRLLMLEFLTGALGAAQDESRMVAVITLDIDNFRQINDSFGRGTGDKVLVEMSQRLRRCVRDHDLVARVGADEFVLVATGLSDAKTAERMCGRLQNALSAPVTVEKNTIYPQATLGIALAPADGDEADALVHRAGLALERAKAIGPGVSYFFTAEMNDEGSGQRSLEGDLRRAIVSDQFVLLFQPRWSADTLRIIGVEALIRWDHPQLGRLVPDDFVPLAEKSGLVVPMGEWVLRKACDTIARLPGLNISVNVSVVQFRGGELVGTVDSILKATDLPPHRLELEITESVLIENTDKALEMLVQLKELGVRLSMDDFGTGYSSLGYLRSFPFDALKIDRSFVGDLDQSKGALAIVQAILGLGRALGMQVVAEGVETESQLACLKADRCDEVQGYYLGRPMTEEALVAFVAHHGRANA
ncbi:MULTISPECIES: bifunctional diguanylate cyclase/phosphodiesterase [unclassified Xanthobacter]|uniref:putative bifunctional diguanylate cyclase/phosphodiesterase n=1 Tax=unclassified Xanthobacter TaxID=2623496 RepID=UPI001F350553|nr:MULTISPECIES: bifunctional diguanylate cyclase/phosphodiesterase [unclassified Xanthobacter]